MRKLIIVLAGFGLLGSAGQCCPVPQAASGSGIFVHGIDNPIPPPYEAFAFPDAVSARLCEVASEPSCGAARVEPSVASQSQAAEPLGHNGIKLLLGFCFAVIASFIYWVSPAYEELYEELFGRLSDFSKR